jgi:hypothetical protein
MNSVPRRENDPKRKSEHSVKSDDRMMAFIRQTLEDHLKAKGMTGADALVGREK